MKEMPGNAEGSLIGENPSINTIYASNDLDEEQEFIPVINAIQGEGFNPLWRQVLIVSTRDLRLTSSFLKRRSWRLRPEPILKSLSSRRTKCIAVRLLARNRRTMELPRPAKRTQEAGYPPFLQLLDTIYTSPPHRSAHPQVE